MEAQTLIVLLGIKNEALRQITIEQRGGRAIAEEKLEDKPDFDDYMDSDTLLIQNSTLEEIVAKSEEPAQIDIEEAINEAESATSAATSEASQTSTKPERHKPTIKEKISAYLDARRNWHEKRMELDYTYECSKKEVSDRTYGFQYMVNYIDALINRNIGKDEDDQTSIHPQ